jgi:transcriptional regulator NrdR family protein
MGKGPPCPHCGSQESKVIDKRARKSGNVRRRRTCGKCHARFSTLELVAEPGEEDNALRLSDECYGEDYSRVLRTQGILTKAVVRAQELLATVRRSPSERALDQLQNQKSKIENPRRP